MAMAQNKNRLVDRTVLPSAQSHLAEEESKLQLEISALEDFLNRLNEIPEQPYRADGGTLTDTFRTQESPTHSPHEAVKTAYQETVLAVDHWEDAYNEETALESIENEFGPDVATGLEGGPTTWSPLLWNQLHTASEEAIETRQQTLEVLMAEQQQFKELQCSLDEIGDELALIERGHYTFDDRSNRLQIIRDQLEQVTLNQQSYLRQRETMDGRKFLSMIYAKLETDYPGLLALTTARQIFDRIELRHWAGLN
ncbi:hypothetical protein SAMN05421858_3512 [Haladaptatus litoreus]|uniref:DUF7260 domain-containing protein n=1 Tax=Haladaptatus litoreus TaxID=553468 RepID=A0A1N7DCN8_9EURY|nr:hypothetical protein [Haladaptatus litoreus]SIR73544.1 hypothetical protein SAMN05421858_3512 [Haladaptatus litoreus]